jgi:hypothetical protein
VARDFFACLDSARLLANALPAAAISPLSRQELEALLFELFANVASLATARGRAARRDRPNQRTEFP